MSDYWQGVLSFPALVLACATAWLALKAVGKIGERFMVGGLMRLGKSAPQARRTATASVVYGAKRSYMLAGDDVGVILVVGMDGERAKTAADLLQPKVSLREVLRTAPTQCPCGCPDDMHIGEIGCPCALPGEGPCATPDLTPTTQAPHEAPATPEEA